MIYDKSGTGTNNYDRTQIFVGTAAGPINSMEGLYADYSLITFPLVGQRLEGVASGFYGADSGYLWINSRLGLKPETALTPFPGRAAFSEWGTAYKLSGYAAWSLTMEFDEDGERWASGIPQWGMVAKWVAAYDPRKDSTYPGGSGAHRWDDESSWEWTENPALHALTYARGRYMNGVKVVGAGIAKEAIDIATAVELANVCDANNWVLGGVVYEGPGISRWDNLKRILQPAAAEPVWVGGMLTFKYSAPKVALDTITADDLAGDEVEVRAMGSWKDRFNSIVPRYRSEFHKWEYVQADAVTSATYLAEDGELKTDEIQFDLIQDVDQAAQLAAYTLTNRREFSPIRMTVKPRLIRYRPGEALNVNIPEAGLINQLAVITSRTIDPGSGSIQLVLESETAAKHAYALGQTGVAPPSPTIIAPGDVDSVVKSQNLTTAQIASLINTSSIIDPDPTSPMITAAETTISIDDHLRRYDDKTVEVLGAAGSSLDTEAGENLVLENGGAILTEPTAADITGLSPGTQYHIGYNDLARLGGAVTYIASTSLPAVSNSGSGGTLPGMHYVGTITTAASGSGTTTTGGGATPPSYNGAGAIP